MSSLTFHPRDDSDWSLEQGLAEVGPGWWSLVREVFTLVENTPGAVVRSLKQKFSLLNVFTSHPDPQIHTDLYQQAAAICAQSRSFCEACGTTVAPLQGWGKTGRNHCPTCAARLVELRQQYGVDAETALWQEHTTVRLPKWH